VRATPSAAAAIQALRARARKSYESSERELRRQDCKVAGYRLLAEDRGGYSDETGRLAAQKHYRSHHDL
jgi:hypothetical protein